MKDTIEMQKTEVPIIKGTEMIFLVAVCVDEEGKAAIAYTSREGVNIPKVGEALQAFGAEMVERGAAICEGPAEA